MGLLSFFTGGGAKGISGAITSVAEVFRPNAENSAQRAAQRAQGAQKQFSAEFAATERKGLFGAFVDGMNRLPRPLFAFGTIGLFVYAMRDPIGFAERMQGLGYIPEPLWWLLGAIVSFYFGARELKYSREGRYVAPVTVNQVRETVGNIEAIRELRSDNPSAAVDDTEIKSGDGPNPALADWRASK